MDNDATRQAELHLSLQDDNPSNHLTPNSAMSKETDPNASSNVSIADENAVREKEADGAAGAGQPAGAQTGQQAQNPNQIERSKAKIAVIMSALCVRELLCRLLHLAVPRKFD
jgi:hypothetical protein